MTQLTLSDIDAGIQGREDGMASSRRTGAWMGAIAMRWWDYILRVSIALNSSMVLAKVVLPL